MATAHQIRELIAQTTTGTGRPRVPREVRDDASAARKHGTSRFGTRCAAIPFVAARPEQPGR